MKLMALIFVGASCIATLDAYPTSKQDCITAINDVNRNSFIFGFLNYNHPGYTDKFVWPEGSTIITIYRNNAVINSFESDQSTPPKTLFFGISRLNLQSDLTPTKELYCQSKQKEFMGAYDIETYQAPYQTGTIFEICCIYDKDENWRREATQIDALTGMIFKAAYIH